MICAWQKAVAAGRRGTKRLPPPRGARAQDLSPRHGEPRRALASRLTAVLRAQHERDREAALVHRVLHVGDGDPAVVRTQRWLGDGPVRRVAVRNDTRCAPGREVGRSRVDPQHDGRVAAAKPRRRGNPTQPTAAAPRRRRYARRARSPRGVRARHSACESTASPSASISRITALATARPGVRLSSRCTPVASIARRAAWRYSSIRCADTSVLAAGSHAARSPSRAALPARKLRSVVVGRVAIDRVDVIDAALRRVFDHDGRALHAERPRCRWWWGRSTRTRSAAGCPDLRHARRRRRR